MASLLDEPRLSLTQAARKLGCHVSALHRWRQAGRISFMRVGGRSFLAVAELERFIGARSDPPVADAVRDDFAKRAAAANARCEAIGL